ncbi:MAG: DUF364 domain-containing protein [candidate division NC10 bacterium]|nr:DUF364 domain-containing protein [candidate division NC10 bacterium]
MITEEITRLLGAEAKSIRIADVRIGLGYTAVLLESGRAGVAYTFREDLPSGCSPLSGERPLAGRNADELLVYLLSSNPLQRALGLATANALAWGRGRTNCAEGDILDALALRPDDRVGMVGFFGPLVPRIEDRVASLIIFERTSGMAPGVEPAERASALLPACSVALISSTTLINGSLDPLLHAAMGCREVVLLGPSTPLLPEACAGTPVTWLSGIVITQPREVLRVVSEGGGTREFSSYARKVNSRIFGRGLGDIEPSPANPRGAKDSGKPPLTMLPGRRGRTTL